MELVIKSRKSTEEFVFSMNFEGGYIRRLNASGCGSSQICEGGGFRGDTIRSSPARFEADCRRWYRAYMKKESLFPSL